MATNITRQSELKRKKSFILLVRLLIYSIMLLIFPVMLQASNYYWVGGSGNWSEISHWATTSGGTVNQLQVPGVFDDVYFDANSFDSVNQTVTVNAGNYVCHSMSWAGVQFNPTFTCAASFCLSIYGSLILTASMNFNYTGPVYFEATAPGNIINMAGKSFSNNITFEGVGGEWTLASDLNAPVNTIIFANGSLLTNGYTINCSTFYSYYSSPRNLNLFNSAVNVSCWNLRADNLNFNCGTSTINLLGASASFGVTDGTFIYNNINFTDSAGQSCLAANQILNVFINNLEFHDNARIYGNFTVNNIILRGNYYEFLQSDTLTISQSLQTMGSCGSPTLICSTSDSIVSVFRTTNGGVIQLNYALLKGIKALGANSFIANNSFNLGDDPGWIISSPAPADLYWVGGNGNWDDPQHWSYMSHGLGGACVPLPFDNVHFDVFSFSAPNQTVTISALNAYCNDMTWTGSLFNPTLDGPSSNTLHIFGSVAFVPGMNVAYAGQTYFEAITGGKTIFSAGQSFKNHLYFKGIGGGWTLLDKFDVSGKSITLENGSFFTNNQLVNCGYFGSSTNSQRVLILGSSVINVTGSNPAAWSLCANNLIFDAGTSTINLKAPNGGLYTIAADTVTYHYVNFTCNSGMSKLNSAGVACKYKSVIFLNNGYIFGDNVFDSLYLDNNLYIFESAKTQTIEEYFENNGSCAQLVNFSSSAEGNQARFCKTSGTIGLGYLIMQDILACGGGVFIAGNSVDLGNNAGWQFSSPAPANLYWVGGSGDWNDPGHWSLSSGGLPGACVPTPYNNVFFDSFSFDQPNEEVTISALNVFCRNISFAGVQHNPLFGGNGNSCFHVYGSMTLDTLMNYNFQGYVWFKASDTGNFLISAGQKFWNEIIFYGGGGWSLGDDFLSISAIDLISGSFSTHNHKINCNTFNSNSGSGRSIILGSSQIILSGSWVANATNLSFNAGTSTIRFMSPSGSMINSGVGNMVFKNVFFPDSSGCSTLQSSNNCSFQRVFFTGNANINGGNTFDTLSFSPSKTYTLQAGATQTILSRLDLSGNGCFPITLKSSIPGSHSTIAKATGVVSAAYVEMHDQVASGGATFYAGDHSINVSGNSGWIFGTGPGYIFGLPDTMGFCPGDTLSIGTNNFTGGINFEWQDGTISPVYKTTQTGQYRVKVTYANQCFLVDTVNVVYNPLPQAEAGHDTVICKGSSVHLHAWGAQGSSYIWSNNLTGQDITVTPDSTMTYSVSVANSCGIATDEVMVSVNYPPMVDAGNDTAICMAGMAITLTATGSNVESVIWSTGETHLQIEVMPTVTTQYSVTAINNCGTSSDQVIVKVLTQDVDLTVGDETCNMANGSITASGWETYHWSNGGSTPTITGLTAGHYTVTVSISQCYRAASATVEMIPGPTASFIITPDSPDIGQFNISLKDQSTGATDREWNFGDQTTLSDILNPVHNYTNAGNYSITLIVTDNNQCRDTMTKTIEVNLSEIFYIPNAFTPNRDGLNDEFRPIWSHPEQVKEYSFSIYDRWGKEVFTTADMYHGWNGNYLDQKKAIPMSTFCWTIFLTDINGIKKQSRGSVFILETKPVGN